MRLFTEMIVASPLALRLHWIQQNIIPKCADTECSLVLQKIDLLWNCACPIPEWNMLHQDKPKKAHNPLYENTKSLTPYGKAVHQALQAYAAGQSTQWPSLPFLWQGISPFRRRVLEALYRHIGHGQSTSYATLAAMAGSPKAARAVGSAMAQNPWPLIIP